MQHLVPAFVQSVSTTDRWEAHRALYVTHCFRQEQEHWQQRSTGCLVDGLGTDLHGWMAKRTGAKRQGRYHPQTTRFLNVSVNCHHRRNPTLPRPARSHVPFTHHASMSNRNNIGAFDIRLTSPLTQEGFTGVWKTGEVEPALPVPHERTCACI